MTVLHVLSSLDSVPFSRSSTMSSNSRIEDSNSAGSARTASICQNKAVKSAKNVPECSRRDAVPHEAFFAHRMNVILAVTRTPREAPAPHPSANKTVRIRQSSQQRMFQNVPEGIPPHTRLPSHRCNMFILVVTGTRTPRGAPALPVKRSSNLLSS